MSTVSQIIPSHELQQCNPYDDLKLRMSVCDLFLRQQCSSNYYIDELSMIRSQCQLMEQIRDTIAAKKSVGENCEEDRQATRDPEISTLGQARSMERLRDSHSPNCSIVSSRTSVLRRHAGQSDGVEKHFKEVERKCSTETVQFFRRILNENKQAKSTNKQNHKLKSELLKLKQEIETMKQSEITNSAKLYETTKKLQAYEIKMSELRDKREEYTNKLMDLETRRLELNKAQINCMVRERLAKCQTVSINEWNNSSNKYRDELSVLKHTIEQLVASPQSFSYRSLADTVVSSLEGQEAELQQQGLILKKITDKMEQMMKNSLKI